MFEILAFVLGLLVISAILFAIGAFVFGRGEELAPAPRDSAPVVLPGDRPPDASDIEALRLSVVLRGYRMLEVDWVLDRVSEALTEKDRQIAELTNQLTRQPAGQSLVDPSLPTPRSAPMHVGVPGQVHGQAPGQVLEVADDAGPTDA